MVWGWFGKTLISLSFIMGFKRTIHQMKGYFFVYDAGLTGYDQIYLTENII